MDLLRRKCMLNNLLLFEDPILIDDVFKLKKALYCLKQAPRVGFYRLNSFLLENDFMRDRVDTTLYIKEVGKYSILVHIYVDDLNFGATNEFLCKDFSDMMKSEFEMNIMGELKFFFGLQIKQESKGIYIH